MLPVLMLPPRGLDPPEGRVVAAGDSGGTGTPPQCCGTPWVAPTSQWPALVAGGSWAPCTLPGVAQRCRRNICTSPLARTPRAALLLLV